MVFDKAFYDGLPSDWENPNWKNAWLYNDWKNQATQEMRTRWPTLDVSIRQLIAHNLEYIASMDPGPDDYPDD